MPKNINTDSGVPKFSYHHHHHRLLRQKAVKSYK